MISTYSATLASYDGDRVQFYPERGNGNAAGQTIVTIDSVIIRRNGQRIPISYNLNKNGGQWKIYDFSIEGISLVQSYRSQFAETLTQGGMPALLKRLIAHNRGSE